LFSVFVVFHVLVCFSLIAVVLMQSSKGEGLAGSSFAGGVSGAVFGGRGVASFLSKATTVLAIVFFLSCATLSWMSAGRTRTASTSTGTTESAVTRQAQEQMQRQAQQQQGLPTDTSKGSQTPVQVTPGTEQPTSTDKK
jgi:preprotein translocase subunit SecG